MVMRPAARMGNDRSERIAGAIGSLVGILIFQGVPIACAVWLGHNGSWSWAWFVLAVLAITELSNIKFVIREGLE
jgi:hypothetical protein